jgi:hypothetical protein
MWNYGGSIDECSFTKDLVISEVYYDTTGKDSEEEYLKIYNPGEEAVDAGYYFITRENENQRLEGVIYPGESKEFKPKFSLPNSGGYVILSKSGNWVDYVEWEDNWILEGDTGEVLSRHSYEKANCEEEWN